ncbi:ornithine carbamoyltransferase [Peribacillus huizhouensis]|uniref:Ornithine carbamoyltransferase n=1 Tax=Peribacillus huizhouensis TaxID=1501239 RepID=A0ABR6CJP0_9BACI|nr:ornithine carbamoyltransferase [Peribacillus huizhouensis]MBA9025203.1 ornithine carbamoyltransferase [Peribacillus huizhouensis]
MSTIIKKGKIIQQKDFLTLANVSPDSILELLNLASTIKEKWAAGDEYYPLKGKTLGMIFEKSSTRTRVSFEVGMLQLGGHGLFLSSNDIQIGRGETVSDTAKVLSQFVDGIMIRTFGHEKIEELANAATIPVINGLTDMFHPCQALADLLTIQEVKGKLAGLKMAYIGDGNNVVHSLMIACAKTGIDFSIACPPGYEPNKEIIEYAKKEAKQQGSEIVVTHSPIEAIEGADIVYADVWTSMGQEAENAVRLEAFKKYQINAELVKHAKEDYIFMHCLPAHREEEVTAEIIDGPNSVVFHQAGNRLHAQKAILVDLLQ